MLQLAEIYEDYAVDVGFEYSRDKPLDWKAGIRSKGMDVLVKYNYHFPSNPKILFEYDFIDKLAHVLRKASDAIVEPAIH